VRAAPIATAPVVNQVHATMEALAQEMGADKSAAEDYILGGEDAPEMAPGPMPVTARYPATETRRPLNQQPLARPHTDEKKGWSIFGRKKAVPDMRAEPVPEPRMEQRPAGNAPRATVQTMQPIAQPEPARNNDDLFPDHKRDEQFEIPAFLRRQSN
jgi:hypothetical protein